LADAGVPIEIAKVWLDWFDEDAKSGSLEAASMDDLSAAFGSDARPLLDRLQLLDVVDETPEGWVLDRIVALAVRHLQE
jgi:hypothetical protein